ncbi:MAG TPA: DUF4153 domain-containing protein, partial [Roseimicrobium sp.]|nr:DUF4153 domain-containing protein [Roseimicrobium sp.]
MNPRSSLLPAILLGAVGLGILGDAVFHDSPFGLNLAIWGGAFLLLVAFLKVRFESSLTRLQSGLLLTAQAGALGLTLHDSAFLHFLDLSVMFVASMIVVWIATGGTIFAAGVGTYVSRLLENGIGVFFQTLLLLADESHLDGPMRDWMVRVDFTRTFRILLGCLLAVPFLLLFGTLFASADTAFRDLVSWLIDFDLTAFLKHLTITGICGWIAAGYLIRLLLSDTNPTPPALPEDGRRSIGAVEIPVILTLLTVLFAAFVFVQIHYLFGNSSLVQLTPGLTYADYARRGFFELVAVAELVLPMLLIGDWLLGEDSDKRWFRRLSAVLIILLLIIMTSATKRMFLYVGEY